MSVGEQGIRSLGNDVGLKVDLSDLILSVQRDAVVITDVATRSLDSDVKKIY